MEHWLTILIPPVLEIVVPLKIESGVACQIPECEGNCSIKWVRFHSTFQYGDADLVILTNTYRCNLCGHEFLPENNAREFLLKVRAICNFEILAILLSSN